MAAGLVAPPKTVAVAGDQSSQDGRWGWRLWLEGSGLAGAIGFLMAGLGNHIVAIVGGLLLVIALVGVAVGIPVADRSSSPARWDGETQVHAVVTRTERAARSGGGARHPTAGSCQAAAGWLRCAQAVRSSVGAVVS